MALQADFAQLKEHYLQFFELCANPSDMNVTETLNKAEQLSKTGPCSDIVDWLSHGLRDLLLASIGTREDFLLHQSHIDQIRQLVKGIDPEQLCDLCESLYILEQTSAKNLNTQLVANPAVAQAQAQVDKYDNLARALQKAINEEEGVGQ